MHCHTNPPQDTINLFNQVSKSCASQKSSGGGNCLTHAYLCSMQHKLQSVFLVLHSSVAIQSDVVYEGHPPLQISCPPPVIAVSATTRGTAVMVSCRVICVAPVATTGWHTSKLKNVIGVCVDRMIGVCICITIVVCVSVLEIDTLLHAWFAS